jgi:hypothetical protein
VLAGSDGSFGIGSAGVFSFGISAISIRRFGPKKSPRRLRFRPPNLLAFRFRVQPPGSASTYSRSVLGARGNLEARTRPGKSRCNEIVAKCEHFCLHVPSSTSCSML